jgi:hypothetical protein
MRWFISWIVTVLLTGIVAGVVLVLDALVKREVGWAATVRSALNLPLPEAIQSLGAPLLIVLAELLCWIIVRALLVRIFAYVNSEVGSSPRDSDLPGGEARNRRRARRGQLSIRLFHNPSGWWLAPFAIAMNLLVWSAASFELNSTPTYEPPVPVAIWGLSMLWAATLAAAMVTPDKAIPVRVPRVEPEREVDRFLDIPAEAPEGESPTLGST